MESKVESLGEKYKSYFKELSKNSHAAAKIDNTNVYEEANPATRKIMNGMLKENFLPDSGFENLENFKAFNDALNSGKRGLILMEHYSNMDLPAIVYLLENEGSAWAKELGQRIVAIAGMKLNEENPIVRAWAEGFSRVIIYPSRSLNKVEGQKDLSDEEKKAEEMKSRKINLAAMHAMEDCKKRGQAILVFPSGTRYRPGKPETKRGLREIDSYLRIFDVMLLVSVNGNCLRINPANTEDMLADLVVQDTITLTGSKVIDCKSFRKEILESLPENVEDPKQKTVDRVMEILEEQHNETEKKRNK